MPDPELNVLSEQIIGACIAVHRTLGPGFLESIYEEALALELTAKAIPFERQKLVGVEYRGRQVGEHRVDLIVAGRIILELKTVESFQPIHTAQVLSYLKATRLKLGLLVNFKSANVAHSVKRIVL